VGFLSKLFGVSQSTIKFKRPLRKLLADELKENDSPYFHACLFGITQKQYEDFLWVDKAMENGATISFGVVKQIDTPKDLFSKYPISSN